MDIDNFKELIKKAKRINPEFTDEEGEKYEDYLELQKSREARFTMHPLDFYI